MDKFLGGATVFCFTMAFASFINALDERNEQQRLAPDYEAQVEVPLWDGTRVDLVNDEYAIEVDWAPKWAEGIGQALYYAQLTGKKPAVLLLVRDMAAEKQFVYRAQTVGARYNIRIYVEEVGDTDPEPEPTPEPVPEPEPAPEPDPGQEPNPEYDGLPIQDGPPPYPELSPVYPRRTVTPDMLEPIGGWTTPVKGVDGNNRHGLHHVEGGLFVEHTGERTRRIYLSGRDKFGKIHACDVSLDNIGTDLNDRGSWPEAVPVAIYDGLLPGVTNNEPPKAESRIRGILRPNPDGPILTACHTSYAHGDDITRPYLTWSDGEPAHNAMIAHESIENRQRFGDHLVTIPKWFADQYLGGRRLGLGGGGKHSGQGWGLGPCLAAVHWPADYQDFTGDPIILAEYGRYDDGLEFVERRPADYSGNPLEVSPPETIYNFLEPTNGEGTWQADDVNAMAWIDTGSHSSLLVWSMQGIGQLDYTFQDPGLARWVRTRCYVYPPSQYAEVAQGTREPHDVRGIFSEWINPFDDADRFDYASQEFHQIRGDERYPCGAYWDHEDQVLYIAYRRSGGRQLQVTPVVVAYRVNTGA